MLGSVVLFICVCSVWGQSNWEVDLEDQGTVRGHRDASGDFFSFLDVPFATVPSGADKFKAPLPPPVWTETFDAVYRGISCPQPLNVLETDQRDDCLVANIYVPDTIDSNLPVMVSIHGGAYQFGAGSWFQYTSLVKTKRLIIITFNYRLGINGFLCLGTEKAPGNAGLKDQVALLRWVKKNIANFGGNPNDVTIQGCSAGGGSVDILTLSPMASGLYNKVIAESGVSMGYTGALRNTIENAKTFARQFNFTSHDIAELEEFFITIPNDVLNTDPSNYFTHTMEIYFGPCVERDIATGEEIFLLDSPYNLLSNGRYTEVPYLGGYTDHEGLLHLEFLNNDFESFIPELSRNFSDYLPFDLEFESEEQREEVANVVRQFYFGDTIDSGSMMGYMNYYTDIFFAYQMLYGLRLRRSARGDTVYLFEFGFTDENTPYIPYTNVRGVEHCAQTKAFGDAEATANLTAEYLQMQETLREMWLNFVETGRPVPENSSLPQWPPVSGTRSPHMAIRHNFTMRDALQAEDRAMFWDEIYDRYYSPPTAPEPYSGATQVVFSSTMVMVISVLSLT